MQKIINVHILKSNWISQSIASLDFIDLCLIHRLDLLKKLIGLLVDQGVVAMGHWVNAVFSRGRRLRIEDDLCQVIRNLMRGASRFQRRWIRLDKLWNMSPVLKEQALEEITKVRHHRSQAKGFQTWQML